MNQYKIVGITLFGFFWLLSCAGTQESASSPSNSDSEVSSSEDNAPESHSERDSEHMANGHGALVTSDCVFEGYPYAVDILLSCGSEEFGDALRLHTFKKHAYDHRSVFNDQLLTYRDGRLWFDAYEPALCAQTNADQQLGLAEQSQACSTFDFIPEEQAFLIQNRNTGLCAGLGRSSCDSHRSTGGSECGGVAHRYLPLVFGDCADGLKFTWRQQVDACEDEYPSDACFNL